MLRKRLHWHHIRIPVHAKKTEESQSEATPSVVTKKPKWAKLVSNFAHFGLQNSRIYRTVCHGTSVMKR